MREHRYIEYPVLYPMGALTFAIACAHCANMGSELCHLCKREIKSGFEPKREPKKEDSDED